MMISLGGTIGTGLFLASGGAIHSAGPGGALVAYAVIGIMVFIVVAALSLIVYNLIPSTKNEEEFQ